MTSPPHRTPPARGPRPHPWAYAFLAPAVIIFGVFCYYPLGRTIFLSLQGVDLFGRPQGFVGLGNYTDLLTDSTFWSTVGVTGIFTVATVALKVLVGILVAHPLSHRLRGTVLVRPFVLIPMALSVAVAGVLFTTVFRPTTGIADQVLGLVGIDPPGWLTDPQWALATTIFVDVWLAIGLVVLLLLAAFDNIDNSLLEAAQLDGASVLRRLISIQLPLITPTLLFVVITQTVGALREFTLIQVLTGGGPDGATTTIVVDLYQRGFGTNADYAASAARGVVLMVIVGALALIQFRLADRKVVYS